VIYTEGDGNLKNKEFMQKYRMNSVRCRRRRLCRPFTFPLIDLFSRTTGPISTTLGRNHAWEMGIQIVQIKGLAFLGLNNGQNNKNLINFKNLLFMNHWPECIGIWYGSFFGKGDSGLFK